MAETVNTTSGVQSLINRIRDEGVQAAKQESERILQQARQEAGRIAAGARSEAEDLLAKARSEIDAHRQATEEALKLSARDTVLQLKSQVTAQFEVFVKRLVTSAMRDAELIRALVLVLAGHAAQDFIADKEMHVMVSRALLSGKPDPQFRERGKQAILALSSDMLREGVTLVPADDVEGGSRVQLVGEQLEIDLSDEAIAKMIYARLLPRFRSILEGVE